jgi:hypothetical protein
LEDGSGRSEAGCGKWEVGSGRWERGVGGGRWEVGGGMLEVGRWGSLKVGGGMLEVGKRRNAGGGEEAECWRWGRGGMLEVGKRRNAGGGEKGEGGGVQMGCEGGVKYSRIMAGADVPYPPPPSLLPIMGMFVCPATNWTPRTLNNNGTLLTTTILHTAQYMKNWGNDMNTVQVLEAELCFYMYPFLQSI